MNSIFLKLIIYLIIYLMATYIIVPILMWYWMCKKLNLKTLKETYYILFTKNE
jgi:hypothetical protein